MNYFLGKAHAFPFLFPKYNNRGILNVAKANHGAFLSSGYISGML
jgi:hypothetical protein